jgi:hypothetical protein
MKKVIITSLLGLTFCHHYVFANDYQPQGQYKQGLEQEYQEYADNQQVQQVEYKEPTTGVEIIFSPNSSNWDKIMANGESELLFGDRRDIRQATSKAMMRAKAEIAKFLKEKINTSETIEEITKTLSDAKSSGEQKSMSFNRKTVETMTSKISNSANAILKGVVILEQNVNQREKYVSVKVGMSRKTMKTADSMSNAINQNSARPQNINNYQPIQQYNGGQNEIRRSRNYDNF